MGGTTTQMLADVVSGCWTSLPPRKQLLDFPGRPSPVPVCVTVAWTSRRRSSALPSQFAGAVDHGADAGGSGFNRRVVFRKHR